MDNTILNQREIQQLGLEMLRQVDRICKAENIPYFLSGGTLLGAVRHQGFIPWDDDVDIMIPRPDYERFLKVAPKYLPPRYQLAHPRVVEGYARPWTRIHDLNTMLNNSLTQKVDMRRLFMDVFPIDALPTNKRLSNLFFKVVRGYDILLKCSRRKALRPNERLRWLKSIVMKFASLIHSPNKWAVAMDRAAARFKLDKAKYAGVMLITHYGARERMPIEVFRGSVPVTFEGETYPAPIGWKTYLTNLYGDYMKLPPEEKRVSLHRLHPWLVPEEERK